MSFSCEQLYPKSGRAREPVRPKAKGLRMNKRTVCTAAFLLLLASAASAQQIAGDWQGALKTGSQELRLYLQIVKNPDNSLRATLLNMGRGREAIAVKSIALKGSVLNLAIPDIQSTYEGKLISKRNELDGTWTQSSSPQPLKFQRATKRNAWLRTQYIPVDKDVTLEVIDWGGTGRPLILLAGLGNTAHIFDKFALKLTSNYHVYGITRRGFGISSAPESGYSADRLGDDVLAVIDALKLDRPVLVGHSIADEELSSVGSRHPEKVSGLIYLDAAYSYAFYDPAWEDSRLDMDELQEKLANVRKTLVPTEETKAQIQELLRVDFPRIQKQLETLIKLADEGTMKLPPKSATPLPTVRDKIGAGMQRYKEVKAPVLSFCAGAPEGCEKLAKVLEKHAPSAKAVALRNADHYVFFSNEEDVLREMNSFIAGLH